MNKVLAIGGLAIALSVAAPAMAHHSAAQFDFTTPTDVEGTVKVIEVNNPHILLIMEVTDEKGTREIEFEGHSRNNVYRRGWRPGMVEEGDKIKISIAPMRNGEDGGYVLGFTTEDGTSF